MNVPLSFTIPDQWFPNRGIRGFAVYFDGIPIGKTGKPKVHGSLKSEIWDSLVIQVLRHFKIEFLRLPYKPPLAKFKMLEFADRIETQLKTLPKRF